MTLEEQVAAQAKELAALREMIASDHAKRTPMVTGRVTPPADLLPAVMALSSRAFQKLQEVTAGRPVTAADLVFVADWDREVA